MNFEEICKIDRTPFDGTVLGEFYYNGTVCSDRVATTIRLCLFHWYFVKFNEAYGTDIQLLDDSRLIVGDIKKQAFPVQDPSDTLANYEYSSNEIFIDTAFSAGFDILHITISEEVFLDGIWKLPHSARKRLLKEKIRKNDPSWHSILWKNMDNIRDSFCYFECGDILILRSKEIRAYELLCEKFPDIMKSRFKKEMQIMDDVIEKMMSPLYLKYTQETGSIGPYKYIYIDMGDGYNYLSFSALNYHWMINCFVFNHLFADLKVKLQQISEIYPELRNVA